MRKDFDPSLYLVFDFSLFPTSRMEDFLLKVILGGVSLIQVRSKTASTRQLVDISRRIQKVAKPHQVPVIVNDRVDVVLASGADGVHLGQSDLSCEDARKILGPNAVIGLSVENNEQALEIDTAKIDYIAASPVFLTPTKSDLQFFWGLQGLKNLRSLIQKPLVAIGGIDENNARDVVSAGADGVAVVRALCLSSDPFLSAQTLKACVAEGKTFHHEKIL